MKLIIVKDYAALSRLAADFVSNVLAEKRSARILLPTGNTPVGMYRELADRRRSGTFDASDAVVFQLDDYLDVPQSDPRSLYGWMDREFLTPQDVDPWNVVPVMVRCYDRFMDLAGGLDLAVLGLGVNGHIGFNEPPCGPDAATRVVDLTPATIASNAAYWGGEDCVPRQAITCGIGNLIAARKVLLLVSGTSKREVLSKLWNGPVTDDLPASHLRSADSVTIIADEAAASS